MSSARDKRNEPTAVLLVGDILKWVLPQVARFPKPYRFGLGAGIEGALLDVLEGLVAAQNAASADRREPLAAANARLQVARQLLRLAGELTLFSDRQLIQVASELVAFNRTHRKGGMFSALFGRTLRHRRNARP